MQWLGFSIVLPVEKKTEVFKHRDENYTILQEEKSKQMFIPATEISPSPDINISFTVHVVFVSQ